MSAKTTHPVTRTILGIIALIAIVALLNVLIGSLGIGHRGVDFTENKTHTLSDGTRAILKELQAPIVIRYYASRNTDYLPEEVKLHMRHVDDLLKEYSTIAGDKLRVENLDPQPDTDAEDSANLDGISGQRINKENLFFGMAISCLDKTTRIPFLNPEDETMLEYQLSKAIVDVSTTKKPAVGVMSALQLAGGPAMMPGQPPSQGWVIYNQLKQSYDVKDLGMTPGVIDPKEIKVLLLFHPADITPAAEYAVDQYLLQGGTVVACLDPMLVTAQMLGGNPMMGGGPPQSSTLPTLLKSWGLTFETKQVVADGTYATPLSEDRKSVAVLTLPKAAMPQKDDVITRDLDNVTLFLSGAFTKSGGGGISMNSLLRTSDKAAMVDSEKAARLDPQLELSMQRAGSAFDLALALSGNFKTAFPNGDPSKTAEAPKEGEQKKEEPKTSEGLKEATAPGHVFLIGDVDAFYDRFAYSVRNFGQMQMVSPINGNSSFLLNIIDQAGGSPHLIGARSRTATRRPFTVIKAMEDKFNEEVGSKITDIRKKQDVAVAKLTELQSTRSHGSELYSPEQEAEITKIRKEQVDAAREIRDLEKGLRRQKDGVFSRIQILNLFVMPGVLVLVAIGLFVTQRSRTRAR